MRRSRAFVGMLVTLSVACLGSSQSLPATKTPLPSVAAARQAVRDRLERAVAGSQTLFARAKPPDDYIKQLGLDEIIREDGPLRNGAWYPALREVREYWRVRPWEIAYRSLGYAPVPTVVSENWPTRAEAPALRELLADEAPAIRGLAVEALGALALPEDIRRIGARLTDTATAAPALARTTMRSSIIGYRPLDEDAPVPLVWSERTVGAYARAAVLLMTGEGFDRRDSLGISFSEWIDLHDLGWESLWYWQQRVKRERYDAPPFSPSSGEPAETAEHRRKREADAYRTELRRRAASDLNRLSADAQAKILLLTHAPDTYSSSGPVHPSFPGFTLRIGRRRILELLDGRNIWSDSLDRSGVKSVLLMRLAGLAPTILPARDWPHVREALEMRAASHAETPVLLSRLPSTGATGQLATRPRDESASGVAARQAVRDRLARAVIGTRELFDSAPSPPNDAFGDQRFAVIPEDRPAVRRGRFSFLRDVRAYWRLRPWEFAYGSRSGEPVPSVDKEEWPTRDDAPALRDLVNDGDPAIRGLAVEALGALGLPEDIRRIGSLLTDGEAAAPALARFGHTRGTQPLSLDDRDIVPMVWSDRTVGAYARAAVYLMTGQTFADTGPSFSSWLAAHDLGWESLWYWQNRLIREQFAVAAVDPSPGEGKHEFSQRWNVATKRYRVELRTRTISDLDQLSADAQAKVYLLTYIGADLHPVTGPINTLFPEGFTLRIGRARILELIDGHNLWKDAIWSESLLLWRLGRLAPTLLPADDWPHVRDELEKRALRRAGMPVLVSRLLPPARIGQADDLRTREGFLRASLARAIGDRRLQFIAAEMVRTNVEMQWPVLTATFDADPTVASWERLGLLEALAEPPHSREKLVALAAFVDDPRNAALLTQGQAEVVIPERPEFAISVVRGNFPAQLAIQALIAFDGNGDYEWYRLLPDRGSGSQRDAALGELRRAVHALLVRKRGGAR